MRSVGAWWHVLLAEHGSITLMLLCIVTRAYSHLKACIHIHYKWLLVRFEKENIFTLPQKPESSSHCGSNFSNNIKSHFQSLSHNWSFAQNGTLLYNFRKLFKNHRSRSSFTLSPNVSLQKLSPARLHFFGGDVKSETSNECHACT